MTWSWRQALQMVPVLSMARPLQLGEKDETPSTVVLENLQMTHPELLMLRQ